MWGYLRDLYQTSGIGETVDPEHIQKHYQVSKYLSIYNVFIIKLPPNLIDWPGFDWHKLTLEMNYET